MLSETFVFKLGHAVVVRGAVQDPEGNPVPNAKVLVGKVSMDGSRQGKSRADGAFSIVGCEPGTNVITAQAKGFAAATLNVNLTDNSKPFELILHPGKLLKLRVLDEDGNPVPHADVWLDTFQNIPMDPKEPAAPQVDFQRQTDAEGHLRWDDAPDGELRFAVSADGYMRNGDYKFRPDGTEHVVTLQHGLTISGTVSDAATGQPIPKFHIVAGNPDYNPVTGTTNFSWSTIDRYWLNFAGGSFRHTWDEPPVYGGDKDPGFVFKFEADGYAPFITRIVHASERNIQFDLTLTAAPSTEVTVLSPDNEPSADADIGLASPGARLSLIPGGLSRENVQSGGSILTTDSAGHFTLTADTSITNVVATSPQGYAEATPAELEANPVMQLQPWGRLDGVFLTNGKPAAGYTLSLEYNHQDWQSIAFDVFGFQAKTDNAGRFSFAQAPPGRFRIMLLLPSSDSMGHHGWGYGPSQPVTINPGVTTTVTVEETNMTSEFANH
jgi:uncharacterized GH25 family protein